MMKFVRYLYEYRDGKRVQNMGFIRVELREQKAFLQIYGKGFLTETNQKFDIYVFYLEKGKCIGISMGTIQNNAPVFAYRLEYDTKDVGGKERFDEIGGIIIKGNSEKRERWYAADWGDQPVDIEQMILQNEYESVRMVQPEVEMEGTEAPQEIAEAQETEESLEMEEEQETEELPEVEEEPVEVHAAEKVESRKRDTVFKITRKELVRLPRCEWKLANNQFLLHGYYNYHHLVSFEKEGACWLGVPGIFHPDEQRVALSFGFDQFMRPDEGEIELSEEQREEDDEFGYWCRRVSALIDG